MFSDLNEKQKEAVFAPEGPVLIVAGAGSGKTKTLTARLAFLISEKKVDPEKILAITFTNKAANEMKKRVSAILAKTGMEFPPKACARGLSAVDGDSPGAKKKEPYVGTFHFFCAKILRDQAPCFGRSKDFVIYDHNDSNQAVKNILKDYSVAGKLTAGKLLKSISRIKSEILSEDAVFQIKDGELVWKLYLAYEKYLEKSNAFDFDDLIEKVVGLFRKDKEILKKYRDKFEYILIDEYQDVNTSQYLLVKLLAGEKNNIYAVGDDQQSIYRFRFSDFRNFLNFQRDWPSAKIVMLEQNYRSTKNIIESASYLISFNEFQKKKRLWTENEEGSLVNVIEREDEINEAEFIASSARTFLKTGMDVGILYRTNAQSRAIEQFLIEYGIPYNIFGAVTFYERKEVKDIVAFLRIILNKNDEISHGRLEKSLGKKKFALLREKSEKLKTDILPNEAIRFFMKNFDYVSSLEKEYENFEERAENIKELEKFSGQFDSLPKFLEKIALIHPLDFDFLHSRRKKIDTGVNPATSFSGSVGSKNIRKTGSNGACLMTIHLAKGLEFDAVFVAGVNEGILPHQMSMFSREDVEEERRLMYVAMTRAKKELFLSFYGMPSKFLYELPGDRVMSNTSGDLNDETYNI